MNILATDSYTLQSLGHEAWHVHHNTFEALSSWNLLRPSF